MGGWIDGRMDGKAGKSLLGGNWMDGWMGGWKSGFKDCLQQSKIEG